MNTHAIVLPTCEVSMDPETAVELGKSWGIERFELKTLWDDRRVPYISEKQRAHLKRVADDYGVEWLTISPGLFIGTEARDELARPELEDKLPRSIELAHVLGATYLIVFGFRTVPGVSEDWVVDKLGRVADAAKGTGLTVVVEPLAGTYCDSGRSLARHIRAVGSDILRANWDPGNVAGAGYVAYPDEYEHVRGLVSYVHLKNYAADRGRNTLFDDGDIDLRTQLAALRRDGYDAYLAVETHTRWNSKAVPPVAATKHDVDVLTTWLADLR